LARRARIDRWGDDETHFINTLLEVVESGETPATKLLKLYHGEWKGDIDRVFAEFSY
jgi:glutamate--cysteine ligase